MRMPLVPDASASGAAQACPVLHDRSQSVQTRAGVALAPAAPEQRRDQRILLDGRQVRSAARTHHVSPRAMPLEDRILARGRAIERVVVRLHSLGFQFVEPEAVFPGPEPRTEEAIERIEREVGPLPLAIKLFWRRVGSVNFMGAHPDWEGCEYPDPLVVYPPSQAIYELEEFLGDREERMRFGVPYRVPIAPDSYHKENVSGGMFYNLSVPAVADDAPLN